MTDSMRGNRAWALAVAGVTAAWAFVICVSIFPGAMSADSIAILTEARDGILLDAHPPIMAIIWRWMDGLVPGPQGMLTLILLLFYGGFALMMVTAAWRRGKPAFFLSLLFLLNPAIIGIIGVIWVDTLMAMALMSATGLAFVATVTRGPLKHVLLALALVMISVGIASRYNAAAAAIPLVAYVFHVAAGRMARLRTKSFVLAGAFVATVALFLVASLVSSNIVQSKQYFWTVLLQYDLAGIAERSADQSVAALSSPATLDDIRTLYTPRSVIPLLVGEQVHSEQSPFPRATSLPAERFCLDPVLRQELVATWIKAIATHPIAYLDHRLAVFGSLIGLPPFQALWAPVFTRIDPNELGVPTRGDADGLLFRIVARLSSTFMFNPAVYLLIGCLGMLVSLAMSIRRNDPLALLSLALYSSGILHMAGLFVSTVSSDFRYSYWLVVSATPGTILLVLSFGAGKTGSQAESAGVPAPVK